MKLVLFTFLVFLAYSPGFAQPKIGQARLDSLLTELPHAKPDTNRVKLLNDLGLEYRNSNTKDSNLKEGINYVSQALALARRLTWKKGMAASYLRLGNLYTTKSDYPQALTAYLSGLRIAEEIKDKSLISVITGNMGVIHFYLANYPQALTYYKKALKGLEEVGDKRRMPVWLGNIGNVYSEQGEYAKALDYGLKGMKLLEDIGFQRLQKENMFNYMGLAYFNMADYPQALTYLQNGLNLSKATGNKTILFRCYHNFSKLYLKIASNNNATFLTTLLRSNKTNTLHKANAYADSAIVLGKEQGDLPYLYRAYQTRSQIQEALGQSHAALASYKDFIATKERVVNQQNTNKIAVATLQYAFDKKEAAFKFEQQLTAAQLQKQKLQRTFLLIGVGLLLALLGLIVYGYTQKQKANTVISQKSNQLEQSLAELKATQIQLIQKEKMASLGELTAGIAHEIQNPLNFVNNFSEVSTELVGEIRDEERKADRDPQLIDDLLGHLTKNLQKINHHGGRASAIVSGMLEHSRTSTGEKRATNINALADEYLKLAYQGWRAKDKDFNCDLITDFDPTMGQVEMMPQEIGRVLLNLFNNAFYAVQQRNLQAGTPGRSTDLTGLGYVPTVSLNTRRVGDTIQIRVSDNGMGIPDAVKAKIFQPFFTTKPTGEGTAWASRSATTS